MRSKLTVLLAGWLCATASTALSGVNDPVVTLQLRNGDVISGALLSESDVQIRLRSPLLGTLRVQVGEVTNRRVSVVAIASNTPPRTVSPPSGANSGVASATTKPTTQKPPASKRWTFDIQAGVDVGFGETDRQVYNSRVRANYGKESFRNSADYAVMFGQSKSQQPGSADIKSADRMDFLNKTDYEIGRRFFLYNLWRSRLRRDPPDQPAL